MRDTCFIGPDLWSPNSLDLNLVVWDTMEQQLYKRRIHDIDELREQLTATWHNREL